MIPFPLLHVKWFVDDHSRAMAPIYDFSLQNPSIITWLIIVSILSLTAWFLDKKIKAPTKKFQEKILKHQGKLVYLFQLLTGVSLLFASHHGAILEPHYIESSGTEILEIIQSTAGILLIANLFIPLAAILLVITYGGIIYHFSFFEAIDYINLLGIAAFLFFSRTKKLSKYKNLGLPLLRIFTGFALFILAFSEKLLFPYKAMEFLEHYKLNFMHDLGLTFFDDKLFTLSAGSVEAAFGIILIFGFITRINTIVLTGFFIASNIYFFVQGYYTEGFTELTGHLPIIATAIILIIYGSGNLLPQKTK